MFQQGLKGGDLVEQGKGGWDLAKGAGRRAWVGGGS